MIKNLLSLIAIAMPLSVAAQSINSDNPVVNIGQVLHYQPATATYTLKNRGSKPVMIKQVDTGCECTVASYPQNSIPAGGEFRMTVTFDGKQLGTFQRSILVTDDSSDTPFELILKGKVVSNVENFSGEYPVTLGNMLADGSSIEFDDVHKGDRLVRDIHIMNPNGQYVEPVIMHTPSYLRAEIIPARIAPKKGGVVRLTLDSRKLGFYGLNQTSIYLAANKGEKVGDEKEIMVSTVLLPEALALDDASRSKAPKLTLSATDIDMTNFMGKNKKKAEIILTNNGMSELEISSLQMFTQGLEVTLPKRKLAPGQSTKMKITGIAAQLKNVRTRPRILMITNDPDNQKVVIEVKK